MIVLAFQAVAQVSTTAGGHHVGLDYTVKVENRPLQRPKPVETPNQPGLYEFPNARRKYRALIGLQCPQAETPLATLRNFALN